MHTMWRGVCYLIIYVKKDFRLLNVITYSSTTTMNNKNIYLQNPQFPFIMQNSGQKLLTFLHHWQKQRAHMNIKNILFLVSFSKQSTCILNDIRNFVYFSSRLNENRDVVSVLRRSGMENKCANILAFERNTGKGSLNIKQGDNFVHLLLRKGFFKQN